jgi:hypothetical protein
MTTNLRPIQFRDYLPEIFRADEIEGVGFLSRFLKSFEALYEELQAEIEGAPNSPDGGLPDLFDPATTPPAQLKHRRPPDSVNSRPDFDFLNFLASWIGVPLRPEKSLDWNRRFLQTAIRLHPQRSTLAGMETLLKAWLEGDLLDTELPVISDLTASAVDVNAIFQLGVRATVGVDTGLGEGPSFFFLVRLITDPTVTELRQPAGLDVFERAARFLLETEKPAHTHFQLRVMSHTMQLPEPGKTLIDARPGAQLGETTLLWDEPEIINSES